MVEFRSLTGRPVLLLAHLLLSASVAAGYEVQFLEQASQPVSSPAGRGSGQIELSLDDGSWEASLGVGGVSALQFLWLNCFDVPPLQFALQDVWVLFPDDPNISVGDAVEIVVYEDDDCDPSTGSDHLASFTDVVQDVSGTAFSTYPFVGGIPLQPSSNVLVGVIPRFISASTPAPTLPAAIDTDTDSGRAWFAIWTTDPPTPPVLPPDLVLDQPAVGTFMIRAAGSERPVTEIPTLDAWAIVALAAFLAAASFAVLRRTI